MLVPVNIGNVAMQTRIQSWTRVRILTGPVITYHWTEAPPENFNLSLSLSLSLLKLKKKNTKDNMVSTPSSRVNPQNETL